MKKILLIDNDVNRLKAFLLLNYIKLESILEANQSIREYIEKLDNYSVLLLHKNYMEDGRIITETVKEFANKNKLVLILFSGEHTRQTQEFIFQQDFYNNLPLFLKHYEITGKIEEDILRYGKNFLIEQIYRSRFEIMKAFINKDFNGKLELSTSQLENIKKLLKEKFTDAEIDKSLNNLKGSQKYQTINDFIIRLNVLVKSLVEKDNENYSF